MFSFDGLRLEGGEPIYQQLVLYFKRRLLAGDVEDGEEMPSRRLLSALLSVNPNTVQKAYRQMEEEGLIRSMPGAKSLAIADETVKNRVREELLEQDIRRIIRILRQTGLERDEAQRLIGEYWNRE